MIYLFLIGLSWYLTKLYYTKTFKLVIKEASSDVYTKCYHCSRQYSTVVENLRAYNYCNLCK
jgi:hypothetical protein